MEKNNRLNNNIFIKAEEISVNGEVYASPDKSISHRSLIIAANALGNSEITNLLFSDDIYSTINALRILGVKINIENDKVLVEGVGIGGLKEPKEILNLGNSGTSLRLIMGLLSSYPYKVFFDGDESLKSRSMQKIIAMLEMQGSNFQHANYKLPFLMCGAEYPLPYDYQIKNGSAQIKSAFIFSCLNSMANNSYEEDLKSRDHTERLLKYFGVNVADESKIVVGNIKPYHGKDVYVPGDPSSALYLCLLALFTKNSHLLIKDVCYNSYRVKAYEILKEMGANIEFLNIRNIGYEQICDIEVKSSNLNGIRISRDIYPCLVDEYIALSIACALANGESYIEGLEDLKNKESNRLIGIYKNLQKLGIKVQLQDDNLLINGNPFINFDSDIDAKNDHRIAMAFTIFALITRSNLYLKNTKNISTSYPNFISDLQRLGVNSITSL